MSKDESCATSSSRLPRLATPPDRRQEEAFDGDLADGGDSGARSGTRAGSADPLRLDMAMSGA